MRFGTLSTEPARSLVSPALNSRSLFLAGDTEALESMLAGCRLHLVVQ